MAAAIRWSCRASGVVLFLATAVFGTSARTFQDAGLTLQRPADLSPQVLDQIDALLREKATWSPVQQKIDSQLLLPVKRARNAPMAAGVPALEAMPALEADGRIVIDVRAEVSDRLLADVRAIGAEVVAAYPAYRDVRLRVAPAAIEAIASLPDVRFVQPKQEMLTQRVEERRDRRRTTVRSALRTVALRTVTMAGGVTSEGDAAHRAAEARTAFGATGAGVTIGVLSDGVVGLAASQASGDLPPTCPQPAGASCITVLAGQGGPATTGEAEGTAMLEIIHDLAPGARLIFATGVNGLSSFAQNIRDLRAAGCDIIVDDVGYFVESPFQDGQDQSVISLTNGGVVIQAVKDVVAAGALYFSSAANSGNLNDGTSGTWEGDFADGGATSAPITTGGRVHSFGAQTYNALTVSGGSANNLFWSDPLGGSSNDYDLFRLNSAGTIVLAASINVQNGAQDPYEQVSAGSPGDRLVIVKYSGAARFLHLGTLRGRLQFATAGETHGHAATSALNSFGVAAVPARAPGPNPNAFNPSNVVEGFSSDGPRRIFFNSAGALLTPGNVTSTGGQVLNKPDFAAADRVAVTGNGGFPAIFTGTSAAAPHAAAIAALIKSRDLSQTADQIRTALVSSAIDIEAPGFDRDSGAGVIMAMTTAPSGSAPPAITRQPLSQSIAFGSTVTLSITASGTAPFSYQWYQGTSPDTATPVGGATSPVFTSPALTAAANYWVRVTNAFGTANSTTANIVITPSSTPAIAHQPQSIGVLSGQSATIGVSAIGVGLTYQWYLGTSGVTSNPIVGQTSAGFTTAPLTIATSYWVRVTNTAGSVDSVTATVSVGTGPAIIVHPASTTVNCGQPATMSVTVSGTAPLTFQWFSGVSGNRSSAIQGATSSSYTTPALGATESFWVRVSNPFDAASSTTATVTVNPSPNCVQAAYDSTLKAPKCAVAGSVCDAGNLLVGRDNMAGGAEPNQPNTILNSCADGTMGTFHVDGESIDGLRVSSVDGTPFAPGKTARIEANVWAFDAAFNFLDLYSAPDATNPSWTHLATLSPVTEGSQTLSATFTLPVGRLQAVRAAFRFGAVQSPCDGDTETFNDRDDLIFAVGDMIRNGDFTNGLSSWFLFEEPDIVHNSAAGGEFTYHKKDPTTTASGQAVIFQQTDLSVPVGTPLLATFRIGNLDTVRKRISALVIDSDFSDLSVCTFWLEPGAPMRTYQMKTHPTKPWANASIYFYAASNGTGDYRLDDVSLMFDAGGSSTRTDCLDPTAPPAGGSAGSNLLTNGDFSNPTLPPWGPFFDITHQVVGGVFEFIRPGSPGVPAGGILQPTAQAMTPNQILTSSFQLGNSSSVRKRVTILLHDLDFSDLSACTFWLAPGQPLSTYTMRSFATKAWTNATLSVYAATTGTEPWMRLDNVTFQRSATAVLGTECIEPTVLGMEAEGGAATPGLKTRGSTSPIVGWSPGSSDPGSSWRVEAWTDGRAVLQSPEPIDLRDASSAHLQFGSWLSSHSGHSGHSGHASSGEVQVSLDGVTWQSISTVPRTEGWTTVEVDLSAFAGQVIYLRFVFDAIVAPAGVAPDVWIIDDVRLSKQNGS